MKKIIILLSSLFFIAHIQAQKHDNLWFFKGIDTTFKVDFRYTPPAITMGKKIEISVTNAIFSDTDGNLLFLHKW
jgi:hypothetical protein